MSKSVFDFFRLPAFNADDIVVQQQINSLVCDLEISAMQRIEIIARINVLLDSERWSDHLTNDQKIDLGVLRINLQKEVDRDQVFMKSLNGELE